MKIWIDINTISSKHNNFIFYPEFLFGVRYLQHHGHRTAMNTELLSEEQKRLIRQENITQGGFGRENADINVTLDADNQLTHSATDSFFANWGDLARNIIFPERKAEYSRKTKETHIQLKLNLDGTGQSEIKTGLGFFDHMLDQIARHGMIDIELTCKGDLDVDEHHTIEDVAIALGKTIAKAVGDKKGIERYGFLLPMDEAQAKIALDFSGRPLLRFKGELTREYVGDFPTEMLEHFFYSLAINMEAALHITWSGENDHHNIEAVFKGFAKCLYQALRRDENKIGILPSSKGLL